ncbi:MAG: TlpA disulfide reductase family protein [Methylophilaceae bacterium]|jgi:thiol-disulfide isomerase/thioredoxin
MQPTIKRLKKASIVILLLTVITVFGYRLSVTPETPNATFTTLKGDTFTMTSLQGKVVLINFWATGCKSCVAEMPELIQTYEQYQDKGFEIVAVAMPYDPPAQVVAFSEQKHLPFPVMHDGYGAITRQFGSVNVTPTTYLYNKDGKRIQRVVGTLDFKKLHTLLDKELMNEGTS